MAFSLRKQFILRKIPPSPSTSLTFTPLMQYTAPLETAQVYLTGLHISQIIGHMIPDYSNNTVPWEYKEVPTKDLRVVLISVCLPQIGQHCNSQMGLGCVHIAVIYRRIPSTTQWWESCCLNQQVICILGMQFLF